MPSPLALPLAAGESNSVSASTSADFGPILALWLPPMISHSGVQRSRVRFTARKERE
jgi:hypothetical protein